MRCARTQVEHTGELLSYRNIHNKNVQACVRQGHVDVWWLAEIRGYRRHTLQSNKKTVRIHTHTRAHTHTCGSCGWEVCTELTNSIDEWPVSWITNLLLNIFRVFRGIRVRCTLAPKIRQYQTDRKKTNISLFENIYLFLWAAEVHEFFVPLLVSYKNRWCYTFWCSYDSAEWESSFLTFVRRTRCSIYSCTQVFCSWLIGRIALFFFGRSK